MLIRTFDRPGEPHRLHKKLREIAQGEKSVLEHFAQLQEILIELPDLSELDQISAFVLGLNVLIQDKLLDRQGRLETLEEAYGAACDVELIISQRKALHQSTTNSSTREANSLQCHNCGKYGHKAAVCRSATKSGGEGQQGTTKDPASSQARQFKPPNCKFCFKGTHTTEECYSKKKQQAQTHTMASSTSTKQATLIDVKLHMGMDHRPVTGLVDPGSNVSTMSSKLAATLNITLIAQTGSITGTSQVPVSHITPEIAVIIAGTKQHLPITAWWSFMIVDVPDQPLILGMDLLHHLRAIINTDAGTVSFQQPLDTGDLPELKFDTEDEEEPDPQPKPTIHLQPVVQTTIMKDRATKLAHQLQATIDRVEAMTVEDVPELQYDSDEEDSISTKTAPPGQTPSATSRKTEPAVLTTKHNRAHFNDEEESLGNLGFPVDNGGNIYNITLGINDANRLQRVKDLFSDNPLLFPTSMSHMREMIGVEPFRIKTQTEIPIWQAAYRRAPADRAILNEATDELLMAGIIRHSHSPWSAPALLVPKPGTTEKRTTVDYRLINEQMEADVYLGLIIR